MNIKTRIGSGKEASVIHERIMTLFCQPEYLTYLIITKRSEEKTMMMLSSLHSKVKKKKLGLIKYIKYSLAEKSKTPIAYFFPEKTPMSLWDDLWGDLYRFLKSHEGDNKVLFIDGIIALEYPDIHDRIKTSGVTYQSVSILEM